MFAVWFKSAPGSPHSLWTITWPLYIRSPGAVNVIWLALESGFTILSHFLPLFTTFYHLTDSSELREPGVLVGYLRCRLSLYPRYIRITILTRMGLRYEKISGSMGYLKGWLSFQFLYTWYVIIPIIRMIIIGLIWLVGMRRLVWLVD